MNSLMPPHHDCNAPARPKTEVPVDRPIASALVDSIASFTTNLQLVAPPTQPRNEVDDGIHVEPVRELVPSETQSRRSAVSPSVVSVANRSSRDDPAMAVSTTCRVCWRRVHRSPMRNTDIARLSRFRVGIVMYGPVVSSTVSLSTK